MSLLTQTEALSIESLIDSKVAPIDAKLIEFADLPPDYIAYNPSKVFYVKGQALILSRVDNRYDELDSRTWIYKYHEDYDRKLSRFSDLTLPWQDPFATHVQGKLIIGGVRVTRNPKNPSEVQSIATEMMIGDSLDDLEMLCSIEGQKDVRPVDMSNEYRKLMGIYGRPQTGHATGDISFTTVETPYLLTNDIVKQAPVITRGIFKDGIWCGANDAKHLSNGHNLVVGHVARYNPNDPRLKEYHGIYFMHDPETNSIYSLQPGPSKTDFPPIRDRDPSFGEIYFAGGIDEEPDITAISRDIGHLIVKTTCGLGDAASGRSVSKLLVAA